MAIQLWVIDSDNGVVRVAGPAAGTRLSGPHGRLSPLLILNAAGEDWLVCVMPRMCGADQAGYLLIV